MYNIYGNYKNALASLLLAGLCFLCTLSLNPEKSRGQCSTCPSGAPDNTSIGWTFGGCYNTTLTIDGNSCPVIICWCFRYISATNYFDYKVACVKLTSPSCTTNPIPVSDFINNAATNLQNTDPGHSLYMDHMPPCNPPQGSMLVTRVVTASCWIVEAVDGGMLISPCGNGGWCVLGQYWCKNDDGTPHFLGSFKTEYSGTCSYECNSVTCN